MSQFAYRFSVKSGPEISKVEDDNTTDSGYGGSIKDDPLNESNEGFYERSSSEMRYKHHLPTSRHQELYRENCHLLTGAIEDTKHLLKVSRDWDKF